MHKLLEKLDKELHKYADKEGELTSTEWKSVFEAIEARKDLLTSMAMEGEDKYGEYESESMYSGRNYQYPRSGNGSYRGGRSMMMDPNLSYSYRGNGGSYRGNNGGGSRRGYSGTDGKQKMLDNLYDAMDEASSDEERMMIQKCIDKLEY